MVVGDRLADGTILSIEADSVTFEQTTEGGEKHTVVKSIQSSPQRP